MKGRKGKIIIAAVGAIVLLGFAAFLLVWNGVILLNGISAEKYEVKGVDVSHYQGAIDWKTLAKEDIAFAFIKATEGSTFVDEKFEYNFDEAKKTHLAVGAYHFFSFDSNGDTQADNFINTVNGFEGMLPPVVDFEFYGDKEKNPPAKDGLVAELQVMLERLEEHYGTEPIIYATEKSYEMYLADGFEKYDIWIRDVITTPKMSDGREWTFWQYTNRGRLDGYSGEEKYIDINVFKGSKVDFSEYMELRCCK